MSHKLVFAVTSEFYSRLFTERDLNRIRNCVTVLESPLVHTPDEEYMLKYAKGADIVISSWGTALPKELLTGPNKLKLLAHAGGTVKHYGSDDFWASGAQLVSAAPAIGFGVAEYCLGMMIVAGKRLFHASRDTREGGWRDTLNAFGGAVELHQKKVGIIAASMVGKQLIALLHNFSCDILVYDPYCSAEKARELGVTKVDTLEELFSSCQFISVNAPNTEETKGMLRGHHFALLQDGSVFINSARSIIINEPEFIEELKKQRFIACIDVTMPEPTPLDHPFRSLPNVILTPHAAGGVANNLARIGTLVADDIERFVRGEPLKYSVNKAQLATMA